MNKTQELILKLAKDSRPNIADIVLVVPIFNEEESINIFIENVDYLTKTISHNFSYLFIDDGSADDSLAILYELSKNRADVSFISLTRNFGKESAMTAGLQNVICDAAIIIDVDLQDPVELIKDFIEYWQSGYDVVYGEREKRDYDSFLKRKTGELFYKIFNKFSRHKIPQNVGDFRLIDKKVIQALNQLDEHNRFMKGLFSWVGFTTKSVKFIREKRKSGTTKFNYKKLWNFALDGILSFSSVALKIWLYIGACLSLLSFIFGGYLIFKTIILGVDVPGYASIITAVILGFGVQMITLGIIGEYISRIFIEVKNRPNYLINHQNGSNLK